MHCGAAPRQRAFGGSLSLQFEVMEVIAKRADCSLLTALQIFHMAEPSHFEHYGKGADPVLYELFEMIHDRINAGVYAHDPEDHRREWSFTKEWYLASRPVDSGSETVMIWKLDPEIVYAACELPDVIKAEQAAGRLVWIEREAQKIVAGLRGNARAQKHTKNLPPLVDEDIQARVEELMSTRKKSIFDWLGFFKR